jgi:hypothetical protein
MKKYRAKFNPDKKGVYAVSLVSAGAMEEDFLQFSEQKKPLEFAILGKDKNRIIGLILEPNKSVLRYDSVNKEEYEIFFTEEDVKNVAYNFQAQGNQNNSTRQHDGINIEHVSFAETWLVKDSKQDQSAFFGLNYPVGSWVGIMDIKNPEVLEDVRLGKYKGFSIDAFMQFEEIKLNKLNKMAEKKDESAILLALKEGFTKLGTLLKAPEKVELEKEKLEKEEADKLKLAEETEEEKKKADAEKLKLEGEDSIETVLANFLTKIQEMIAPMQEMIAPMQEEAVAMSKEIKALELKVSTQSEELIQLGKAPATPSVRRVNLEAKENLTAYEKFRNRNK